MIHHQGLITKRLEDTFNSTKRREVKPRPYLNNRYPFLPVQWTFSLIEQDHNQEDIKLLTQPAWIP